MNDKTKSKVVTKIEIETLKDEALGDEELENVAGGANNYLFELRGVDGESTDDNHKKWIDVLSVHSVAHKRGS